MPLFQIREPLRGRSLLSAGVYQSLNRVVLVVWILERPFTFTLRKK